MEIELEEIHVVILAVTVLAIIYSDHKAFQYFRGTTALLDYRTTKIIHRVVWAGLIGMVISGIFLVVPMWEYLLAQPAFYVKMAFVAILAFNGWVIGSVSHVASERPFAALEAREKRLLLTAGTISAAGWVGAALIGFFFL